MRWLVALLLLTSSALAEPPAQPCPSISAGWTIPFSGPITSVGYDQTAQMLDVAFGPVMTTFANVPLGVMQGFQNASNAKRHVGEGRHDGAESDVEHLRRLVVADRGDRP